MIESISNILKISLDEKTPVGIFLQSKEFYGQVTRLDSEIVEIRQNNKRIVIRLDKVEAVIRD